MKVSIVTITYNRAHLMGETIQSVLNQSYNNFEHIIIDDGSTDNTEQVVTSFKDDRIKYFKLKKVGNLNKLRNYGIIQSDGELIAILDSDDLWVENKLEVVVGVFKSNSEIKFLIHNISYFKSLENIQQPYYIIENSFFEKITSKVMLFQILPFPNYVFKKDIIQTVGLLNESLYESLQDFLFQVSCQYKIFYSPQSLTLMRIHDSNIHTNKKGYLYYTDYYRSATELLLKRKIGFGIFVKGITLNSKNFLKYLLK